MSQNKDVRTVSVDVASAQRAGGLISDFMMQRIVGGWCLLLLETNGDRLVAVRRNNVDPSDDNATTFTTADEALATIYQIGFDVSRLAVGMWRPEPKHMERVQNSTMAALKNALATLERATKR